MEDSFDLKQMLTSQHEAAQSLAVSALRRHILLCCDQSVPKCCVRARSLEAWNYLKSRLDELGLTEAGGVYRTKANRLRICFVVVYLKGAWYGHCDPPALERIIQEHLIGGQIVSEYLIAERALDDDGVN